MTLMQLNDDLSKLLQSENNCEYTEINDGRIDKIALTGNEVINVLHLNIRSFNKSWDSLTMLLNEIWEHGSVVHIIGLCETSLTDANSGLVTVENYKVISKPRSAKAGGGVMLLLHDSVQLLTTVNTPFNKSFKV